MKAFKRTAVYIAIFVILVMAGSIPGAAIAQDQSDWTIYFRPGIRFGFDDRVIGYYDLMVPVYRSDNSVFFLNPKFSHDDSGGFEWNLGMGYRHLLWDDQLLLGLNAYYDHRRTGWGTYHYQWGVGLEAMADIPLDSFNLGLTARVNYYHPFSNTKYYGMDTEYAVYYLSNTGIIFEGGRVEEPMKGLDYEVGMRIPYVSDYVETWAYAGGYHYFGKEVDNVNGFVARLEVIPTDFVKFNYEFRYDNYQEYEHYGEISLEVPFSIENLVTGKNPFEGMGDALNGSRDLEERLVEPVRRDVDVVVVLEDGNNSVPGSGEQIEDVVFVSENGSDVTGDGTKSNPYATISYALANDGRITSGTCSTIHVMNSSTTAVVDEASGGGLTLTYPNFLLWGSGANHPAYPVYNMPYTGHPSINDTLTLNAANPSVTGLGFVVTSASNDFYCIDIANGAGVKIFNNVFNLTHTGSWEGCGIRANIATLGSAAKPILIANNTFDINSTHNGLGIFFETGCVDIFATITDNTMDVEADGWGRGILFNDVTNIGSAASPVIISGNNIFTDGVGSPSGVYGIQFRAVNASDTQIFAHILRNDISVVGSPYGAGINFRSENSGGGTSGVIGSAASPLIISGNTISVHPASGSAFGINFWAESDIFSTITGNDMSGGIAGTGDSYGVTLYSSTGDIFAGIGGNYMNVTSTLNDAYGGYLEAAAGIIGDITSGATYFGGNSGTINGSTDRYLLYLDGTTGGGNSVDWSDNAFTPVGGGWSGNYDAGDSLPAAGTGPVETNFGVGDILTP